MVWGLIIRASDEKLLGLVQQSVAEIEVQKRAARAAKPIG